MQKTWQPATTVSSRSPVQQVLATIIFCSLFGVVFLWSGARLFQSLASLNWPSVNGMVTKSAVKYVPPASAFSNSNGVYQVDFAYKYSVNGNDLEGHDESFGVFDAFPGVNRGAERANQLVDAHPGNTNVTVYYDPKNPQTSVLTRGPTFGLYYLLAFSTFFLGGTLYSLLNPGLMYSPLKLLFPLGFAGFLIVGFIVLALPSWLSHDSTETQSGAVSDAKSLYDKAYEGRYHIKDAAKVEAMYEKAIAAYRTANGGPSADEYDALIGLGGYCEKVEVGPAKAIDAYERADKVWVAILGKVDWEKHPLAIHNLGPLINAQKGEMAAAATYEDLAKQEAQKVGADHPLVQNTLSGLAGMYEQNGHYAKAYPIYEKILVALSKSSGKQSPEYGRAQADLGDAYLKAGDKQHALPLLKEGYENQKKNFGNDAPIVQWASGRLSEASK
jgi:Protein of unknown function (DUF3592)/Tetratricopeptide repeat